MPYTEAFLDLPSNHWICKESTCVSCIDMYMANLKRNAIGCKHVCFLYCRSTKPQRFCSRISTVFIQCRKSLANTSWPRKSMSPVRRKVPLGQQCCIQANGVLKSELWSLWQSLQPFVNGIRVNEVVILSFHGKKTQLLQLVLAFWINLEFWQGQILQFWH